MVVEILDTLFEILSDRVSRPQVGIVKRAVLQHEKPRLDKALRFGNSATVTQMFTGQERDGGTAVLDYFNARHLSAVLGSFTQPDPGNAGRI